MDIANGSSRFRHRKTLSSDRFLGPYPHASHPQQNSPSPAEENELNEDDIFSTGDFSAESSSTHSHHSPSSSASSTPRRHRHHLNKAAFPQSDSFGILAALPEHKPNSHQHHLHHHLYQKTTTLSSSSSSSSAASSSSARMIPSIPKPPQERVPISASFLKYHQSAPVNVPVLSMTMRRRGRDREFEEIIDEDDEGEGGGVGGDGEMLPPHEMAARAQSPLVACSVLEGVGRTLKGRDLRQVRNAVWRRTGFLD